MKAMQQRRRLRSLFPATVVACVLTTSAATGAAAAPADSHVETLQWVSIEEYSSAAGIPDGSVSGVLSSEEFGGDYALRTAW